MLARILLALTHLLTAIRFRFGSAGGRGDSLRGPAAVALTGRCALVLTAFAALSLAWVASASATTHTWKGPAVGDWNTSSNWTNGVPTVASSCNVVIGAGKEVHVTTWGGAGSIDASSAAIVVDAGGDLIVIGGGGTIGDLVMRSGKLTVYPGPTLVATDMLWESGTTVGGLSAANATKSTSGVAHISDGAFNASSMNWTAGDINLSDGAVTFTRLYASMPDDCALQGNGSVLVWNLEKSGAGRLLISANTSLMSTVKLFSGTLALGYPGSTSAVFSDYGGALEVLSNYGFGGWNSTYGQVDVKADATFNSVGSMSQLRVISGDTVVYGTLPGDSVTYPEATLTADRIQNGHVTAYGSVTCPNIASAPSVVVYGELHASASGIRNLTQVGDIYPGPGGIAVADKYLWRSGRTVGGKVTLLPKTLDDPGCNLELGGLDVQLVDATLANSSTVDWDGTRLIASGASRIENSGTFRMTPYGDRTIAIPFYNRAGGNFEKLGDHKATYSGVFSNEGTVTVSEGTLALTGAPATNAGKLIVSDARLEASELVNSGTLRLRGSGIGAGGFTQSAAGTLSIEPTAGRVGQLQAGSADLDGALLIDGTGFALGQILTPLTYSSRTGEFDTIACEVPGSELTWVYDASALRAIVSRTPPVTTSSLDNEWHTAPVTVTLTATDPDDAPSALVTRYVLGSDPTTLTYSTPFEVSNEGITNVQYWSVDAAGIEESPHNSGSVMIDRIAPMTTSSTDDLWHNHTVPVTLTADDANSGVASTSYAIDGISHAYDGAFDVSIEGDHVLSYASEDIAGNTEATQVRHVRVDKSPPHTTSSAIDIYGGEAEIQVTGTDEISTVAYTEWRIDEGTWNTGTMASTNTPGIHTVEYRSVDRAGNVEDSHSVQFVVRAYTDFKDVLGQPAPPSAVAQDQQGTLYVGMSGSGAVKLDASGSPMDWLPASTMIVEPVDIHVAPDGLIYVTDFSGFRVQAYTAEGEPVRVLPVPYAGAVASDLDGNVLVLDLARGVVSRFAASDGAFLGDLIFGMFSATDMCTAPDGTIYVTGLDSSVRMFSSAGLPLGIVEPGHLASPQAVSSDEYGYIYVVDMGTHDVEVFSPDGQWHHTLFRPGTLPGELTYPWDLDVTAGVLAVADNGNYRVQRFTLAFPDVTPPTTQASGFEAGWNREPLLVTLERTDGFSGVLESWHQMSGSDPVTYTAPFNVSGEGTTTIEYWSVDRAGNEELPHKTVEVQIDSTPPESGVTVSGPFLLSASIPIVSSDAVSGVASTHWRIGSGPWQTGSVATTGTLGDHVLEYYSVDVAGNEELPHKSAPFRVRGHDGAVTGTITNAAVPQNRVIVSAFDATTHAYIKGVFTDATGAYTLGAMAPGGYHLRFTGTTPASLTQFYDHAASISAAATVTVIASSATTVSSDLAPPTPTTGTLSGTITAAAVPQNRVVVAAFDAVTHAHIKGVFTDALGAYSLPGLAAGTYHLRFTGTTPASLSQFYDHKAAISDAVTLTVTPGAPTPVSTDLAPPATTTGAISGTVTAGGVGLNRIVVTAFDATTHAHIKGVFTDAVGAYTFPALAPGSYHLRFTGTTPASLSQFYDHKSSISAATTVTVGSGVTTPASSDLAP